MKYYVPLRAYVRKPPSTTSARISWLGFPSHPQSIFFWITLTMYISFFFSKDNKTRVNYKLPSVCSDSQPSHSYDIPSPHPHHLPRIPLQGNIHTSTCYFLSSCDAKVNFPLCCPKYYLRALTFFLWYFRDPPRPYHLLNAMMRPMENLYHDRDLGNL